jgi:hypothetical protein
MELRLRQWSPGLEQLRIRRFALVYTVHKDCGARRTGAELCAGADAYSQASKRDLRREALECAKLPNMFGSAANRYPPRKCYDSQTMPI